MSSRNGTAKPSIIVFGALSAIAEAAERIWAEQGAHLLLVAATPPD